MTASSLNILNESVSYLKQAASQKPKIGLVLGSGLGSFVDCITQSKSFPFQDIPHFAPTTIEGHKGFLHFGMINKIPLIVMQGRIHRYEGHALSTVTFPIRVLAKLGIGTLLLTNAAGGLGTKMKPGDLMIIKDHINLMGDNPLIGPNVTELGPRFPDMSEVYDRSIRQLAQRLLKDARIRFHQGVYCGLLGPSYETPAEIRFLRKIGVAAVGMSTVPEAIVARHMGLRVFGISCITNLAAGLSKKPLNHKEVTETGRKIERAFSQFLNDLIISLDK